MGKRNISTNEMTSFFLNSSCKYIKYNNNSNDDNYDDNNFKL